MTLKLCFYIFAWLFLIVCFTAARADAQTSLEKIDPINLLESRLAQTSENVKTPTIPQTTNASPHNSDQPAKTAELQFEQRQTQVSSNVAANFAAQVDQKTSRLFIAGNLKTQHEHQLWQARISALDSKKDHKTKQQLQQIIQQIRSLEFRPQQINPKPLIVVEPTKATEPNEISSDTEAMKQPGPEKAESKPQTTAAKQPNVNLLPYKPVTAETLEIFKNLLQQPGQLKKPSELAEVLFRSGHLKEAAKCYQEALDRIGPGEADQNHNAAWILFQIGNCLRNDDPPTALEMYRKLIAEYSDSPWVDLAKARTKLINWYLQDKPQTLIGENYF